MMLLFVAFAAEAICIFLCDCHFGLFEFRKNALVSQFVILLSDSVFLGLRPPSITLIAD